MGRFFEDRIVFFYRLRLMLWFVRVWKVVFDVGVYGVFVFGLGFVIFVLGEDFYVIGKVIVEVFLEIGVDVEVYIICVGVGVFWF